MGEPKEREFQLNAVTGRDGVVVFALNWQKRFPWTLGERPKQMLPGGSWIHDEYKPWIRAVDDLEKVQAIEIRHSSYRRLDSSFDFRHLLEFGQNKKTDSQRPQVFHDCEKAWVAEMNREGVKFCVLDLGTQFPDFQNPACTRPEFFQKIRDKDFGAVYTERRNWFSRGQHPQSICGPYFVYLLKCSLQGRQGRIEVVVTRPEEQRGQVHKREADHPREPGEERRPPQRTLRPDEEGRPSSDGRKPAERDTRPEAIPPEGKGESDKPEQKELVKEPPSEPRRETADGISVEALTAEKRRELDLLGVFGLLITSVDASSPWGRAGLRPGMVILDVQHRAMMSERDFNPRLKPGDELTVGFLRRRSGKWERASVSVHGRN